MSQSKATRTSRRLSAIPVASTPTRPNARNVSSTAPCPSSPPQMATASQSTDNASSVLTTTAAAASIAPLTATANAAAAPASGIPAFRALRSLLPFGPGRPPPPASTSPPAPASANKSSSFMNFTSVRKSMSTERKNSLSYGRPSISSDDPPNKESPAVISIHALTTTTTTAAAASTATAVVSVVVDDGLESNDGESHGLQPEPTALVNSSGKSLIALPTELSTIIEADTSGISKHVSTSLPTPPDSDQPDVSFSSPDLPPEPILEGPDDSVFDLSTSKLQLEVNEALSAKDYNSTAKWLEEDVVDDADQTFAEDLQSQTATLNLSALDPDLADLLKPDTTAKKWCGLTPPSTSPGSPSRESFKLATSTSTPARRRSLLTPASSRMPSSSSLPRIRPSTARPSIPSRTSKELPLLPPAAIHPDTPSSDSALRRGSLDRPRTSPSTAPPSPASQTSWTSQYRKPPSSRLANPSRHASYSSAIRTSPRVPPALASAPPNGSANFELVTPSASLNSFSLGSSAAHRLLSQARASLEDVSRTEGSSSVERYRPSLLRSRKRSMSVEAQRITVPGSVANGRTTTKTTSSVRPSSSMSGTRPSMDWLGPRTARVFAAAGLIDSNTDDASNRSTSRAGLGRVVSERNPPRVQPRASSRIGVSEASGSNSSWGVSHTLVSDTGGGGGGGGLTESPTFSIHRSHLSCTSTAATSVSAISVSTQHHLQTMIQSMKEKHGQETEALLGALSDSQHNTRAMRAEMTELRERIQYLENQLEEARMIALRCQTTHGNLPNVRTRANSAGESRRLHSSNMAFVKNHEQQHYDSTGRISSPSSAAYDLPSKTQLKRISAASSIFPVPPSNMKMLMAEEGITSGAFSSRSVSPPISAAPISSRMRHSQKHSLSSGGNVSPTTANFSMTEMPGSPGSLRLRPEHEMHLGDMVSLDLGYHPDEDDL